MEPLVCIIILNWNGFEVTKECIESLFRIEYKNFRIILIDNGSHDDSVRKLRTAFGNSLPDIIALDKNYGFTGGNNRGIAYAMEKYDPAFYLLLNNDTIVDKCFLSEMVNAFHGVEKCFAVVPKIFYYSPKDVIWYAGGRINRLTGIVKEFGKNKRDAKEYDLLKKVSFMNGCCALLSNKAIKELGVLDDQFFAYSEDTDYSLRIQKSEHSIVYAPKSVIYHKVSYSSESNKGKWFAFYLATRNIILLQKKHLGKAMLILFSIAFGVRWVAYLTVKLALMRDFRSVKCLYLGVVDGISGRARFYK